MALSAEVKRYVVTSNLKYTENVHRNQVQDYFKPIFEATDNPKYQRIAVKACHAVGKTFNIARIIESMMSRFNFIKIISTAPTFRQVHDLLWKEIHTAYSSKPKELRRGTLNQVEWWINSETFAKGFSPQKSVKAESGQGTDSVFQGYHAKYMTVVVFDEAVGVPPQIWAQAEGLLTSGERVLFLVIANPTSRNCDFYKCFKSRSWKTFSITCFDSPNLKAAGIKSIQDIEKEADYVQSLEDDDALERLASYPTPVSYLINTRWVIEKAIEWGVSHPLFQGKVIGEFPDSDSNCIATEDDVKESQSRNLTTDNINIAYVGLDVARFGEDKSVLTAMVGERQVDIKVMAKNDTNEVVGYTIAFIEKIKRDFEAVNDVRLAIDGGFGHGVIDVLRESKSDESNERVYTLLNRVHILEINFGGQDWVMFHYGWIDEFKRRKRKNDRKVQEDRENFTNFKSKMFELLGNDIKKTIQLMNVSNYQSQLPSILKQVDSKGRLKIESKEDYKTRTGETSPDEADSLALCNFARYFPIKKMTISEAMKQRNR